MRIGFKDNTKNCVLKTGGLGYGVFDKPIVDTGRVGSNLLYRFYASSHPFTPLRRAVYGLIQWIRGLT